MTALYSVKPLPRGTYDQAGVTELSVGLLESSVTAIVSVSYSTCVPPAGER